MRKRKYTKKIVETAVLNNFSWASCLRSLGIPVSGGNHRTFQKWVKYYGIDTSHFTGKAWNKGKNKSTSSKVAEITRKISTPDSDIFCANSRATNATVRRRLLETGKDYVCEECGLTNWRGKDLTLHLDHLNGDANDNRKENLRFLCPNCHQQTATWGKRAKIYNSSDEDSKKATNKTRKDKASGKKRKKKCLLDGCDLLVSKNRNKYCSKECARKARRVVERPKYSELLSELENTSYSELGRKYGVSDNTIRNWLDFYENRA